MIEKIIDRISSYQFFNFFYPGIIFIAIMGYLLKKDFTELSIWHLLLFSYFVGMTLSRIGSLLIESPMIKWHILSDKTPQSILEQYDKPYIRKSYSEERYDETSLIEWFDEEITSEINETSVVLYLNLDNTKFLFTGDAGKKSLEAALDITNNQLKVTHLQLPHHGSRKNIDPDLLRRINATYYMISCPPDGEKEGHPSRRLMNKILELNPYAEIYKTKDVNFIFHEGVEVKTTPQTPQKVSQYMDGKIIM